MTRAIQPKLVFLTLGICILLFSCRQEPEPDFVTGEKEYLKVGQEYLEIATVADDLKVPWGMDILGEQELLFTEIEGNVKSLNLKNGQIKTLLQLPDVFTRTTPGLLDIAVQKAQKERPFVFLHYTRKQDSLVVSSLMRYVYDGEHLVEPKELLTIKGALGHNGGRILLDDQDKLFWATGDAADNTQAQDSTTLNGKLLRMNLDGTIPEDNPIAGSYVYAWGFRNIQGLAMTPEGELFSSEHGDAIEDEVNWIRPLHNYGWPLVEGKHDTAEEEQMPGIARMTEPIRSWTPVIAPAGMAYYGSDVIEGWKGSLLLVTLKSQSFRVLSLGEDQRSIASERVYFTNRFGRIRAVLTAPNGDVYLSSSNHDWNPQPGFPLAQDDRIIRIRKTNEAPEHAIEEDAAPRDVLGPADGSVLYQNFCASCHQKDGGGLKEVFPALKGSSLVSDGAAFADLLLQGTAGRNQAASDGVQYEQDMASFDFLTDQQLSAIINYVNTEFAEGDPVSPEQVKAQRDGLKNE